MWEKIKDLLYEISDLLLAFAIILVMTTVITWKVTDSLAFTEQTTVAINETTPISSELDTNLPALEETKDTASKQTIVAEREEPSPEVTTPLPVDEVTTQPEPQPAPQPTIMKVTIPSGSPGINIAKILKNEGLIEDTSIFIKRVEELKLASKLKSGTFHIQTGSSLDDIIYTITGKKK
ncbi:MAG: endolytic transglycosylase MltG [Marinisporobacter sp.]|jgi:hypothetical protein|nr:endolytic transglycosylase MltG [Marinisporobacter sp.]